MDYKWRFSIQKPDATWIFATSTLRANLKLTVAQRADLPPNRPPLTLVAHTLTLDESTQSLKELVTTSTQLLTQAGSQEFQLKGSGWYATRRDGPRRAWEHKPPTVENLDAICLKALAKAPGDR